jgi:hypothetical protein
VDLNAELRLLKENAGWSSLVACQAHNPAAAGSRVQNFIVRTGVFACGSAPINLTEDWPLDLFIKKMVTGLCSRGDYPFPQKTRGGAAW